MLSGSLNVSFDLKWTPDADTVAGTGLPGNTSLSLWNNAGIRIVDNNTLYIADFYNHRVVVIQPGSTNAIAIIGSYGNASHQLNRPTDVFVTSTSVYILDAGNYRVQMWPKNGNNGTTVAGTGGFGSSASLTSFGYSYGIYLDKYGYLYVCDQSNSRVLRYPPGSTNGASGAMVAGTGIAGAGLSQLYGPSRIFVDTDLSMYIADTFNNRIQKWAYGACSGVTVAGNGIQGSSNSQLNNPSDVLLDANGFMFISDGYNNRILRWLLGSPSGECIAGCSGIAGTRADQLNYPTAVKFDSSGFLYVSDCFNNRVQKFSLFSTSSKCTSISSAIITDGQHVYPFSSTDSVAHGTMDTISSHRRWISSGYFRKWIFSAHSESRHPNGRQQHTLYRR